MPKKYSYRAITKPLVDAILQAVSQGEFPDTAALNAGVELPIWRNWIEKAATTRSKAHGVTIKGNKLYYELALGLEKAEAMGQQVWLNRLMAAKPGEWQRCAWYLERRYPAYWSRTTGGSKQGQQVQAGSALEIKTSRKQRTVDGLVKVRPKHTGKAIGGNAAIKARAVTLKARKAIQQGDAGGGGDSSQGNPPV